MSASVTVTVQFPALRFVGEATEVVCVPLVHKKFCIGEPPLMLVIEPLPLFPAKQETVPELEMLAVSGVKGAKKTVLE